MQAIARLKPGMRSPRFRMVKEITKLQHAELSTNLGQGKTKIMAFTIIMCALYFTECDFERELYSDLTANWGVQDNSLLN